VISATVKEGQGVHVKMEPFVKGATLLKSFGWLFSALWGTHPAPYRPEMMLTGEVEFDESSHLPDETKMRLRKGLLFPFSPLKDFVDGFKGQVFEGAGMLGETLREKGFMDALKAACSGNFRYCIKHGT